MQRIIIFGAQGLLGSEVFQAFSAHEGFEAIPLASFNYDITQPDEIERAFTELSPDIVINCAAFSDVDAAEELQNKAVVFAVNAAAPLVMAQQCAQQKLPFFHFSTDFVFDGERGSYSEIDKPQPVNVYGESKKAGEVEAMAAYPDSVILRTARLFGEGRNNLVGFFRLEAKKGHTIEAIDDEYGNFTYAPDIAVALTDLVEKGIDGGIYHLVGVERSSPFEVAEVVVKLMNSKSEVIPISAAGLKRKAERPRDSSLVSHLPYLRSFHEALPEFLKLKT